MIKEKELKLIKMETKYLIIGNSIAGVSCAEAICTQDPNSNITVISDEGPLNYSRPLISYYLGKKVTKDEMSFKDFDFYEKNNVKVFLDTRVLRLDTKHNQVQLSNGKTVKFKKILIATGGKPIIPPIEGLQKIKRGIFTFTKLSDAQALIDYIQKNKIRQAVVLGAGLIGLKCTEGLVARGLRVTIVELADRILANTFDKEASLILEEALNYRGCKVIKEDTIAKVSGLRGKITKITLKSGEKLSTKLLILAVGVCHNKDLVRDTSIIVNEFMETNIKNIYAAGDVAQGKDFLLRTNSVLAIWPVACRQGKIAGLNMAGEHTSHEGSFIMNSVELAGIPTISFGITNPECKGGYEVLSKIDKEENFYRKIVLKDNRIVGAIFLGKIERSGIFSGFIKEKIDVSSFMDDLLSDDFGFLVLPAEYRKHLVRGEGIYV